MFPPAFGRRAITSPLPILTTCGIQYRGRGWNAIAPLAGAYALFVRCNIGTRHCERSEAIQKDIRRYSLDCFVAEPVIGPAQLGRTRWLLAMTSQPATAVDT